MQGFARHRGGRGRRRVEIQQLRHLSGKRFVNHFVPFWRLKHVTEGEMKQYQVPMTYTRRDNSPEQFTATLLEDTDSMYARTEVLVRPEYVNLLKLLNKRHNLKTIGIPYETNDSLGHMIVVKYQASALNVLAELKTLSATEHRFNFAQTSVGMPSEQISSVDDGPTILPFTPTPDMITKAAAVLGRLYRPSGESIETKEPTDQQLAHVLSELSEIMNRTDRGGPAQ